MCVCIYIPLKRWRSGHTTQVPTTLSGSLLQNRKSLHTQNQTVQQALRWPSWQRSTIEVTQGMLEKILWCLSPSTITEGLSTENHDTWRLITNPVVFSENTCKAAYKDKMHWVRGTVILWSKLWSKLQLWRLQIRLPVPHQLWSCLNRRGPF